MRNMTVNALLGRKIGTTQFFTDAGEAMCVTAVEVGPCIVTQIKTDEKDGYAGVQIGFQEVKGLNKPKEGHLKNSGSLFRHLREVNLFGTDEISVGQKLDIGIFETGETVDVTGISKGRGFAGGVKRYNFKGGPKTHGQSDRHRAPGSIGAGSTPGRVIKGLKMAGHMGDRKITVRNLRVVKCEVDTNIMLVQGGLPGANNSILFIKKNSS